LGREWLVGLEKILLLEGIDHYWKEHLASLDYLKEGIGLSGYGQKNPLDEYQKEAFSIFASMLYAIKRSLVQNIFIVEKISEEDIQELERRSIELHKQREAQVQEIHDAANKEQEDESALNRKQRRKQDKPSSKLDVQRRTGQNARKARKKVKS
jgi:preprotein translocase subunit SecA